MTTYRCTPCGTEYPTLDALLDGRCCPRRVQMNTIRRFAPSLPLDSLSCEPVEDVSDYASIKLSPRMREERAIASLDSLAWRDAQWERGLR